MNLMWLFSTIFWKVLNILSQLLTVVGIVGSILVSLLDLNFTLMSDIVLGIFAAGIFCFLAMVLAFMINSWFFKEIE